MKTLSKVLQENLKIILSKVDNVEVTDVVDYECGHTFDTITVSCIAKATEIAIYGRTLSVNGGINHGVQLGWITEQANGNYKVTC